MSIRSQAARERGPRRARPDAATGARPPTPSTRLIGRRRELALARRLMRGEGVRLLTVTGPAGVGKTRLALAAAAVVAPAFPDGVSVVDLAPIADPELVAASIARALGLVDQGPDDPASRRDRLGRALSGRRLLLVLDNFEQVAAAAPQLAELLAACPDLAALVTSRRALHLRGEQELPLLPLALPDPERSPPLEELARCEAVRLFVERARAVRPEFGLTERNAAAVVELCRGLDGLPLAIELAAARARLLSPEGMLARLGSRLALLTGGPADAPSRQRSLRAALDWSHDLLAGAEQALFRRLGVFVGGFSLEAAEAVATDGPADAVLDGLGALVDQSLLRREETPDGETRYRMLETVREYARERLAASGEAAPIGRRHAGYFVALAERDGGELHGPGRRERLVRLERELPNMRAALAWSVGAGEPEPGLRLGAAVEALWIGAGRWSEGRRWLDQLLALPRAAPPPGEERRHALVRARALTVAGDIAHWQYDRAAARALLEESLALARAWGDDLETARVLSRLAILASRAGDNAGALPLDEESLALRRKVGDPGLIAHGQQQLALVVLATGDAPRARALLWEALASRRELGDRVGAAWVLQYLGYEALRRGALTEARSLCEEGITTLREEGERRHVAWALLALGAVARAQGDAAAAGRCYQEALRRCWELGSAEWTAVALAGAAGLAADQGRAEWAARLLGAARSVVDSKAGGPAIWDQDAYERDLARARTRLGADAALAAWEIGRASPLAETVRLAMAEEATVDRPPTPADLPGRPPARRQAGPLTAREHGVAALVARGLSNRQIGAELVIAERTVGNHLAHIMNKLGVHSRAQVAVWAAANGPGADAHPVAHPDTSRAERDSAE